MGLDALLARLSGRADTPDTPCNPVEVSAKPSWIEVCTLDTPDTPQIIIAESVAVVTISDMPGNLLSSFRAESGVDRNTLKRCPDCQHFARPGKSDGYCGGRDDLPLAYGANHPLRRLPVDRGATCEHWQQPNI